MTISTEYSPNNSHSSGFRRFSCKLNIGNIYIVTHGDDEENPFIVNDVTKAAKGYSKWINDNIWDLNRMQKQPEEIQIIPGEQCIKPYECWYYGYCHGTMEGEKE